MERLLKILEDVSCLKGWYPENKDAVADTEGLVLSKLIELGMPYAVNNGVVQTQYGEVIYSLDKEMARKYLRDDWFKYIFPEDIQPEPQTGFVQTELPVQSTVTHWENSMKKEEFTYAAIVVRHISRGIATSVKIMSSPVSGNKILFWFNNGKGEYIDVLENEIRIPVQDKFLRLYRNPESKRFALNIDTQDGCKAEPRYSYGGNGGHIVIDIDEAVVHIIPKNYKQKEDGSAEIIYYIEARDGSEACMVGNSFQLGNNTYSIKAVWQDPDRTLAVSIDKM